MPDYSQDYSVNAIVRWFAYHLGRNDLGDSPFEVARTRFPGIGDDVFFWAIQSAQAILEVSNRVTLLRPQDPLSNILGGLTPPAASTYINFRVTFEIRDAMGNVTDTVYREVQWRGSWDTLYGDIYNYAYQQAVQIRDSFNVSPVGAGATIASINPDSTIWFPHPSQL